MSNEFNIKSLSKRLVENTHLDKETNTLFVTNPGVSPAILRALADKNGFKIGSTKTGEYISIPMNFRADHFEDKYVSQFNSFLDSYTNFNKNYHSLLTAYKVFDLIDENIGEVDLMLSTYMEEVLSAGFVDDPLVIKISNPKAQEVVDKVLHKNKFFAKLPMLVRNIAKYGNYGMTLSYPYLEASEDGSLDDTLKSINVEKDLVISFINPKFFKVICDNHFNVINYQTQIDNTYSYTNNVVSIKNFTWQPWQFVHYLLSSPETEPYGKSMLWSMRSAFDQLTTLEALLAVSRASKVQRLVISIPVPPGMSIVDSYQYMSEFKGNYLSSLFADAPGTRAGRKIPGATSIFVKPAIEGFDIDHIQSNIDLSSTEDVEYFLDKILRNSKLPKGYLIGEDVITTAQALESMDLKLSRGLIPLKQALVTGTLYLVECILAHAGFDVTKVEVEVTLNKPIQPSNDLIVKYNDIIELVKSINELNPMTNINQYQLMLELGIPVKVAKLINSKSSLSVIANKDDLKSFVVGQKSSESSFDAKKSAIDDLGEHTKPSAVAKSKTFLKENVDLIEQLKEVYDSVKGSDNGRVLLESKFTPKVEIVEEAKK